MKRLTYIIAAILMIAGCKEEKVEVEPGVSRSLAAERAENIGSIRYELAFDIPSEKTEPVSCDGKITFTLKKKAPVVLDFQGTGLRSGQEVNGKAAKLTSDREHIVIPGKYLRKGENTVSLSVISGDGALNRNDGYMYTLFVPDHARSAFPCFDQPDMKARFTLRLTMPQEWTAISNGTDSETVEENGRKTVCFSESDLLPTYLFSFTAGLFKQQSRVIDGRKIKGLYRETAPEKVAQLDTVFHEIGLSIKWLEEYTGIKYPFQKYGFVVLPGYQFGGMEHPGAIQFNDKTVFLGQNPTPDEELHRLELFAHETAHMWFGDLVTMRWFNDVWTKEVFANFLAAKISHERFPEYDQDLNFLKSYQAPAVTVDRTAGTHPIQQPLDNLNQAGLLYGNIIYDKAPVMLRKLEAFMGEKSFREGVRKYLRKFSYGNATWDDLIACLAEANPETDVEAFSQSWVKEKGMPAFSWSWKDGQLIVCEKDESGSNVHWFQQFRMGILKNDGSLDTVAVDMGKAAPAMQDGNRVFEVRIPVAEEPAMVIPNLDGSGYGYFRLADENEAVRLMEAVRQMPGVTRMGAGMTVYENYLRQRFSPESLFEVFMESLENEENPLVASTLGSYAAACISDVGEEAAAPMEKALYGLSGKHGLMPVRQQLARYLCQHARSGEIVGKVHEIWKKRSLEFLGEGDYMSMAYHLAIMLPEPSGQILQEQRSRLTSDDRRREFDFVSRACSPDNQELTSLFESLMKAENRAVEPWTLTLLSLLNDRSREPFSNGFIRPGLDILQEVQRTGDIFFPGNWCSSLLSSHRSDGARKAVEGFLADNPDYPEALRNKLLQSAYMLMR